MRKKSTWGLSSRMQVFKLVRVLNGIPLASLDALKISGHFKTSRERHKSAPYLRLKNSARTLKVSSILSYSTRKTKKSDRTGAVKEGPFGIFQHPLCDKISKKLKGGPLFSGPNSITTSLVWQNFKTELKGGTLEFPGPNT